MLARTPRPGKLIGDPGLLALLLLVVSESWNPAFETSAKCLPATSSRRTALLQGFPPSDRPMSLRNHVLRPGGLCLAEPTSARTSDHTGRRAVAPGPCASSAGGFALIGPTSPSPACFNPHSTWGPRKGPGSSPPLITCLRLVIVIHHPLILHRRDVPSIRAG